MLVPEEVETFLAVVRAGSFQGGAEVINATQSTVSHRVPRWSSALAIA